MDRARVITTLQYFMTDAEFADELRADAHSAGAELRASEHYEESVVRIVRGFLDRTVSSDPSLAGAAEILVFAFRAGFEAGLSIGAVRDEDWGL